ADPKTFAGNDECLASVDPLAEVGHQIAEGTQLPALVEPFQAFRNAVVRRRDLVGIDSVELLSRNLGVPEDQGTASHEVPIAGWRWRLRGGPRRRRSAALHTRRLDGVD